jgi:uncharacterized protein YndB with AHSA1/START domain
MLRVSRTVAAPAARVWEALVDTRRWPQWGPSITAVDVPADRLHAGMRGRVRTALGAWLPFEVTEYVEGAAWRWRVAGVRATGHRVEARGPAACRLTFEVPVWAAPYAALCAVAARRIARMCERPGPQG